MKSLLLPLLANNAAALLASRLLAGEVVAAKLLASKLLARTLLLELTMLSRLPSSFDCSKSTLATPSHPCRWRAKAVSSVDVQWGRHGGFSSRRRNKSPQAAKAP